MMRKVSPLFWRVPLTLAAFVALMGVCGLLLSPERDAPPELPSTDAINVVRASRAAFPARDVRLRPRIQVEVDYAAGTNVPWWPRGEPSILLAAPATNGQPAQLLTVDGVPLPPVAARVGSEPLVLAGVEDQDARHVILGPDRYGGLCVTDGNLDGFLYGMGCATLLRWSPQGDPVVPHVARAVVPGLPEDAGRVWFADADEASKAEWATNTYAAYDVYLRRGSRWSDGHFVSAFDVAYWWWYEANNEDWVGVVNNIMVCAGMPGRIWLFEIDPRTGVERPFYARPALPPPDGVTSVRLPDADGGDASRPVLSVRLAGDEGRTILVNPYRFMVTFSCPRDPVAVFDHLAPLDPVTEAPNPNGLFMRQLATPRGLAIIEAPAHYLWRFNPSEAVGDAAVIEAEIARRSVASRKSLYVEIKRADNPEHPRLWPWIPRDFRTESPFDVYRNPYYFAVDRSGNQLPYIDRIHLVNKSREMRVNSAAAGELTFAIMTMREHVYEQIMAQRDAGDYDVYHWFRADRSLNTICFNLLKRVDPTQPGSAEVAALLRERDFRRALSLAIDRQAICDAEFYGMSEPSQCAPGPSSRFYYEHATPPDPADPYLREAYRSYIDYDPEHANDLLDGLGLTRRDREGMRMFPDGVRLTLFVDTYTGASVGPLHLMVRNWHDVGVRAIPRIQDGRLYWTRKDGLQHDMTMFPGENEYEVILEPRLFVPIVDESNYAIPYARWYMRGGMHGRVDATDSRRQGIAEPPRDPTQPLYPLRRAMELYDAAQRTGEPVEQERLFREIQDIAASNLWSIAPCTTPPIPIVVRRELRNVPRLAVMSFNFCTPASAGLETYYFGDAAEGMARDAYRLRGTRSREMTQATIATCTPFGGQTEPVTAADGSGRRTGRIVRLLVWCASLLAVVLLCLRHPYIARRLAIMAPTLLIISVIVFTVIQLPPGDFLTSMIIKFESMGDRADLERLEEVREMFHLDRPMPERYCRWMGFYWFKTFADSDRGLLQGQLGRRMEDGKLVNDIVGDRIVLTFMISLLTILLTWAVAIPLGIYSAVRQYSIGDYVLTTFGFIGMCIPSFLLALLIMYASRELFGLDASGLFSSAFSAQQYWDWAKCVDLLKHIWVPVLVLGVGGTAGMIRVMRANLLDELQKPYVTTARAKGVPPFRLLMKYPVRLALNPFVSGIGGLFPALVSGGTIVAVVLSLPTVGELMLTSLQAEDMFVAGSMLMILSLLGVVGTLVSDLLLLALDPRIRFER